MYGFLFFHLELQTAAEPSFGAGKLSSKSCQASLQHLCSSRNLQGALKGFPGGPQQY